MHKNEGQRGLNLFYDTRISNHNRRGPFRDCNMYLLHVPMREALLCLFYSARFNVLECYLIHSLINQWLYKPLCWAWPALQFRNLYYTVGSTPWTSDQPVARPLPTHSTTQTQNKRTHTSMPWVGFEPAIPAFELVKTIHALDRAATMSRMHTLWHICSKYVGRISSWAVLFATDVYTKIN
jgi:hypothetical protein